MLLTADHDDRVVPLHSFKHIAELQYQRADNPHPLLLRVDSKAGHGAGKSTEKKVSRAVFGRERSRRRALTVVDGSQIEEAAEKYGFVSMSMGLEYYE